MFLISFGLSEIVDSPTRENSSYLRHEIHTIEFNLIEVELSNGSVRTEAIVENTYSYATYPLEIPRSIPRKAFWIDSQPYIILFGIPSRPQSF